MRSALPPPPPGDISGTYATSGTLTPSSECGDAGPPFQTPQFDLTINQTGNTFTASGTVNTSVEDTQIQATINGNGTVSPTNQLSGPFTLNITINVQGFPPIVINGTFTGSVTGNTLTVDGSGPVSIPGVDIPPGCSFNVSLTGTR